MGLQWFRRGQRGSDGSDDPYDDEFDSELEPLRPVTLGGESGNLSRSGIQGSGLSDRGRQRSSGRRGWRSDSSVASGSSDVGIGVGTVGVLRAYGKGAPLRVIGASTTGTANYWYVQAASVIKAVKDINGKTIAYWTSNVASKYDVFDLIKQYRLNKARPVAISGPAATFNQVMSGHVDVGWAEAPFGVDAVEQGKTRVVARASEVPAIRRDTVRVLITNDDTLQKRKDVLARFMQAYRETVDWMYSDAAALTRYAELAGVSEGIAKRLRDEFFTKDMLAPDKVVGLDAIMKDAITSRYIPTPLSKAQIAELIQIPAPAR